MTNDTQAMYYAIVNIATLTKDTETRANALRAAKSVGYEPCGSVLATDKAINAAAEDMRDFVRLKPNDPLAGVAMSALSRGSGGNI